MQTQFLECLIFDARLVFQLIELLSSFLKIAWGELDSRVLGFGVSVGAEGLKRRFAGLGVDKNIRIESTTDPGGGIFIAIDQNS